MKTIPRASLLPVFFLLAVVVGLASLALPALAEGGAEEAGEKAKTSEEVAIFDTNHGRMVVRFHEQHSPKTVAQIKRLVTDGFYDGKQFYRVVSGHVIQAGDVDGESAPTVPLEAGLPHIKGAVGLARDSDPDSGTTEIYICHVARPHLDGNYAIFGQVIEGLDVLDRIAAVPVDEQFVGDGVAFHRPKEPVVIERAVLETRGGE